MRLITLALSAISEWRVSIHRPWVYLRFCDVVINSVATYSSTWGVIDVCLDSFHTMLREDVGRLNITLKVSSQAEVASALWCGVIRLAC
jgi:hypothetical protein